MFWKKSKTPDVENQPFTLPRWEQAKWLSEEEAADVNLSVGWYIYQPHNSIQYYALRPNPNDPRKMEKYSHFQLSTLEQWLGIPIPELPPTHEPENAPTLDQRILEAQKRCNMMNRKSAHVHKTSAQIEASRKRSHRVCVRMNDEEYNRLQNRLFEAGLTTQSFLLSALNSHSGSSQPGQLIDVFSDLCEELDQQITLLSNVLKYNSDRRHTDPEDWQTIVDSIKSLQELKADCIQFMEEQNGDH